MCYLSQSTTTKLFLSDPVSYTDKGARQHALCLCWTINSIAVEHYVNSNYAKICVWAIGMLAIMFSFVIKEHCGFV